MHTGHAAVISLQTIKKIANKMSESGAASLLDTLVSLNEDYKYGIGKNNSIIKSSSAIVSSTASLLLVWILFRSRNGLTTTYHRLLLGLSAADVLFALSLATFGAVVPREMSYIVWNARGSQASCTAFGFIAIWGGYSGLLYMCSLNLYYLAQIKYNKTDSFIAKKIEKWLHAVPILYGLIVSIVLVAKQGMSATINGNCTAFPYTPPHCTGYEDGAVPEGFEIPCGRGRSSELFLNVTGGIVIFLVPVIIGGSLRTIYRLVLHRERRNTRYGAGALQPNRSPQTSTAADTNNAEGGGNDGRGGAFSIMSAARYRFRGWESRTRPAHQDSSQSSAVLHKAAAYSVACILTWMWYIIYTLLFVVGAWPTEFPRPAWATAFNYLFAFFQPLQGLWTLVIYLQPKVARAKRSSDGNTSWCGAFAEALSSAVAGGDRSPVRGRKRARPGASVTAATSGGAGSNAPLDPGPGGTHASAAAGSADRRGECADEESVGLEAKDAEDEKREIQGCEPSV